MANISLYGASYTDVPACTLPQTGGGEVLFTDTSPTTAAAADVAAGKYFFTANGVLTLGTSSGGIEDGHVWQDENGYIHLSDETGKVYQTISKSYTPTETAQSETITPSSGYDAIEQVSVSVGAISSSYVGSGITRRSSTDLTASGATVTSPAGYYASAASKSVAYGSATTPATTITANPSISVGSDGLITATASATKSVTPTVSAVYVSSGTAGTITVSGSNTSQLSTQAATTITPTTSSQTAVAAGKYTTGAVTVAAMPTGSVSASATKGTVSNHSVSVTPTATVGTAGYLAAGSTNGTAVTVSASELVSGNKEITANGTNIDVADYSTVSVAVPTQSGGMSEADLKNFIERSGSFTDIDWPSGLTTIGNYVFATCTYFAPSSLPSGLTSIGNHAFEGCQFLSLTSLPSGVTSIGEYAFYQCFPLTLTSLPSGLTRISQYAFYGCRNIELTSLPSGVTNIGNYAFYNCSKLALTSLPSGLTSIGGYAFSGCTGITTIECSGTLTTLTAYSWNGASGHEMNLTSASFPNAALATNIGTVFGNATAANACKLLEFCDIGSTTGIAANAFANCYALETLVLRKTASVCTLANVSAFSGTPMRGYNNKTGTVYVPSDLISSYQTATNWSTLYNNGTVTFSAIEGSDYEL